MPSPFERYRESIKKLSQNGLHLYHGMQIDVLVEPDLTEEDKKKALTPLVHYQGWYAESLALIKQLMPDRTLDFQEYYSGSRPRKEINVTNYTISDYLRQISGNQHGKVLYDKSAALNPMIQQYLIVASILPRLDSLLFDIKTLVQADLLDDELGAATELNNKGFARASGALCGVVLEAHLSNICDRRKNKSEKQKSYDI